MSADRQSVSVKSWRWVVNEACGGGLGRLADEGWRFISIVSAATGRPGTPFPAALVNQGLVLSVDFDDIVSPSEQTTAVAGNPPLRLMSQGDAGRIVEFLRGLPPGSRLLVHCSAGISRSGAVGLVASEILDGPQALQAFMRDNPQVQPNPHCLSLLKRAAGLTPAFEAGVCLQDVLHRPPTSPECLDGYACGPWRSVDVLVLSRYGSRLQWDVGYCIQYDDEQPTWHQRGPDAWALENVMGWRLLPEFPA